MDPHLLLRSDIVYKRMLFKSETGSLLCPLLTIIQYLGIVKFFESLIEKLFSPSPSKPVNTMDSSGIVLVAGATGGVGRRVVDILRKKGLPVRVLVFLLTFLIYFNACLGSASWLWYSRKVNYSLLFNIFLVYNSCLFSYSPYIVVDIWQFFRSEMKRRQERCWAQILTWWASDPFNGNCCSNFLFLTDYINAVIKKWL